MNPSRRRQFHLAILSAVLFVFAFAVFLPAPALADCCKADDCGHCDDGTKGTPCCGYGKCNIFCCNCDGGCRKEDSRSIANRFTALDFDQSGGISLEEFEIWTSQVGRHFEAGEDRRKAFEKLDSNKNRVIDPGEFDKSLVNSKGKARPAQ